jgi:type III pantothenate kinase
MMLIAIDIGNTKIKCGEFTSYTLSKFSSFNDEADVLNYLSSRNKNEIAISSVVPDKTKTLTKEIQKLSGKTPFIITREIKTNLKISYKNPETLGADRLCSAEGAYLLFRNSEKVKNYKEGVYILSVDMGTATTITVIEYPANFIGGLISPGINMMFDSLVRNTAQLPHLDVNNFESIIGNDTNTSIASGVITSVSGMIEKTINYLIKDKSAEEVLVYLTGGNAKQIIPHLKFKFVYDEGLVLYGIYSLWKKNKA